MDQKDLTNGKLQLFPDQLISLLHLAQVLPANRLKVLCALIEHLEMGTLKSDATQKQIKEMTGLSFKTIQRYIKQFRDVGLLKQWRGKYELKQCFYRLNLPVTEEILEFYVQSNRGKAADIVQPVEEDDGQLHQLAPSAALSGSTPTCLAGTNDRKGFGSGDGLDDSDVPHSAADIQAVPVSTCGSAATVEQAAINSDRLAPEVGAVIDKLEQAQNLNTTGQFLTSVGLIPPQIASDERIEIDRDGLFQFLKERGSNSISGFTRLVKDFSESPPKDLPPRIDLKVSNEILLGIHYRLERHALGNQWLLRTITSQYPDVHFRSEQDVRRALLDFMAKNGLRTLDDLIALAMEKDAAIKQERKKEADRKEAEREALRRRYMDNDDETTTRYF
jgi:hypothetical protein